MELFQNALDWQLARSPVSNFRGRQTIIYGNCITEEEAGVASCASGAERNIDVRTPSGRAILEKSLRVRASHRMVKCAGQCAAERFW